MAASSLLAPHQWNAARIHLHNTGFDFPATAKAFNINEKTLRKRSERYGWRLAAKEARRQTEQMVAESVAKTTETLASLGDSLAMNVARAAKKASEGLICRETGELKVGLATIQDHKTLFEMAWKAMGRDKQEAQVQVNLWSAFGADDVQMSSAKTQDVETEQVY